MIKIAKFKVIPSYRNTIKVYSKEHWLEQIQSEIEGDWHKVLADYLAFCRKDPKPVQVTRLSRLMRLKIIVLKYKQSLELIWNGYRLSSKPDTVKMVKGDEVFTPLHLI